MDELAPRPPDEETFSIGEGLYGLSVHELEARIAAYRAEIARLQVELDKKSQDRIAADTLFAPKQA